MVELFRLIKELCPDGVEYKKIGCFAEVKTGKGITKKDSVEYGAFPIISGGKGPMGYYHSSNRLANTLTISRVGANAGFVNYITEDFYLNDKCFSVVPISEYADKINNKFLYYVTKNIENEIVAMQSEGGVPTINTQKVCSIKLPIPPLPVQKEIVKILDKFTDCVTELQAELQARKQQYEYYLNRIIDETPCQEIKLKDIATVIRGGSLQKKDFVEEGKPCIHYGQLYTHFGISSDTVLKYVNETVFDKSKHAESGDIVMAVTSENIEDVCSCTAWIGADPIAVSGHTAIIKHNQNAKWLSYYFHSEHFYRQKTRLAHGTKVIEVTPIKLGDIIIPLPTYDDQEKAVAILEQLYKLSHDLTVGLPAEIEARQKQYEYYRDRLLTFKRKE